MGLSCRFSLKPVGLNPKGVSTITMVYGYLTIWLSNYIGLWFSYHNLHNWGYIHRDLWPSIGRAESHPRCHQRVHGSAPWLHKDEFVKGKTMDFYGFSMGFLWFSIGHFKWEFTDFASAFYEFKRLTGHVSPVFSFRMYESYQPTWSSAKWILFTWHLSIFPA